MNWNHPQFSQRPPGSQPPAPWIRDVCVVLSAAEIMVVASWDSRFAFFSVHWFGTVVQWHLVAQRARLDSVCPTTGRSLGDSKHPLGDRVNRKGHLQFLGRVSQGQSKATRMRATFLRTEKGSF